MLLRLLLPFIVFLSPLVLTAQNPIVVNEASRQMSKGMFPSYLVEIPRATLKDLDKSWQKYISAGSKSKVEVVAGEITIPGAVNTNVSPYPFTVYSKVLDIPGFVRLTVWLMLNDSSYVSSAQNADQGIAGQKYVRDFALQEYRKVVSGELKIEETKLKGLEKEREGLLQIEEKSNKKINESKREIQRCNDRIATTNGDIQNTAYKISDQKNMVEKTVTDKNAYKGAKKTLSDYEKEKKKLQKLNESEAKAIDKLNQQIRTEERAIAALKEKQKLKSSEIEKQKQQIAKMTAHLEEVK